jgi:hypothetical protein
MNKFISLLLIVFMLLISTTITTTGVASSSVIFTDPTSFNLASQNLGPPMIIDFNEINPSPINIAGYGRDPLAEDHYIKNGFKFSSPQNYDLFIAPGGLFWNPSNSLSPGGFPFDSGPRPDFDVGEDDLIITLDPACVAFSFRILDLGATNSNEYVKFYDQLGNIINKQQSLSKFIGIVSQENPISEVVIKENPNDNDDITYDDFSCVPAYSTTLLFFEDFSIDNEDWVDESNGHIFRDQENQWLEYYSVRSATQRYYIPVSAKADYVEFKFRFNTLEKGGNGGVAIGLVENLTAPGNSTPFASGFFIHVGGWKGNSMVTYQSKYADGKYDGISSDLAIKYGPFNSWKQVSLVIDNGKWTLVVNNDDQSEIGRLTGVMSQKHSGYNYIFVGNDAIGGWEYQRGLIDDFKLYGFNNNHPPNCLNASPGIESLWPPNHKMVPIDIVNVTDPDGDPIIISIDEIWQDEPVDSTGDGSFVPDGMGIGSSTAWVRAERDGGGNGRVYHISYTAIDSNTSNCSGKVLVSVPISQNKNEPSIDEGPLYESTHGGGLLDSQHLENFILHYLPLIHSNE